MRYRDFEELFSAKRMQKYLVACNNDTRRALTLYRYNLKLSQEMWFFRNLVESIRFIDIAILYRRVRVNLPIHRKIN